MKLTRTVKVGIAGVVTVAALVAGGAAYALGDDDGDVVATGPDGDRARAAALALLPGGIANSVERDNEAGATWEVEVTRADGKTVDVRLDAAYQVVVIEGDTENEKDEKGEN
ncbi:MAG: PepSY domain-containing protein [Mycobacteriales bacterium]